MSNHPYVVVRAALALALAGALPWSAAADPRAAARYVEDALVRYEKQDIAGAIVQLKNALKEDGKMLPAHVLLGKALLAQGEVNAAEVALNDALRLGVDRSEVVVPLAQALLRLGRPQELLDGERFAPVDLPPRGRYELLLARAAAYTDVGDGRAALKSVQDARAIDAADAGSWVAEVPVRIRARQYREASSAADKAVALAPGNADAQFSKGEAQHVQGDLAGAGAAYDRALALNPAHVGALVARAGVALDQNRTDDAARDVAALLKAEPREPRGVYLSAMIADRQGQKAVARAALAELTGMIDPVPMESLRYRPQTLMLGGMAHFALGQREKARPYLEAVLRTQPNHTASKLLADIHLAEKNYDRAVDALEAYLRGSPGDGQAQAMLASAHMAQGRYARATQVLQDALKQKADQAPLRTALGLALVGGGRFGDAIKELEAAFAKDPAQLQAGYALASLHLQAQQPARAAQIAETLLKHHPRNPGVHNLLGSARRALGNAASARAAFEQALQRDPAFAPALIGLARLDTAAGNTAAAEQRLQGLLAKDAGSIEVMTALAETKERERKFADARLWYEKAEDVAGNDNIEPAIALVDFHLRQGQLDQAREAVKRANGKRPDAVPALLASARVALASGDAAGARAPLARAATNAGYNAPVLTQIALLQLQAGSLQAATHTLDKALGERPDFLPAQALRADLDLRAGEPAKAEQRGRQILAQAPQLGVGHAILGDAALARGAHDAAIEAYRRAHELDRSTDSALRLYGALLRRDAAAAQRVAEQWVKTHPRDTVLRRAMADQLLRAGNLPGARTAYEALLELVPDDGEVLNNLAYVLAAQGDPRALKVAERALALNPQAPHVIGTAGWAAYKAGQPDRALQLLRDARLRDPSNPNTRYFLGAVLASQGRKGEARDELAAALRSSPAFEHRATAEKLLTSLQ